MKKTRPGFELIATAIAHGLIGLVGGLVGAWLWSPQLGASFAVGALLTAGNFLLLGWVWGRLMDKKSIAWTAVIIVIKYTVLLGAIFFLSQTTWFHVLSAGLGVASFAAAALLHAALFNRE